MIHDMTIALAQMDVIPGEPRVNVDKMISMIKEARQKQVDMICFPEMCIGGYLLGDKFLEDNFGFNKCWYGDLVFSRFSSVKRVPSTKFIMVVGRSLNF